MCRLLLCVKENINKDLINRFLFQSVNRKNTPEFNNHLDAEYNKDGYGFAYWVTNENKWFLYKSDKLFINDNNFNYFIDTIIKFQPTILIGHLRNKGHCNGCVNINNVHPFIFNNYIFCHNGFIKDFIIHKIKILDQINQKYINELKGETDSEYIFYLLLSILDQTRDECIEDGYIESHLVYLSFIKLFEFMLTNCIQLVGNFILSNGKFIIVFRYIAKNFKLLLDAPSLYFNDLNKKFIISSEPIVDNYKIFNQNDYTIITL